MCIRLRHLWTNMCITLKRRVQWLMTSRTWRQLCRTFRSMHIKTLFWRKRLFCKSNIYLFGANTHINNTITAHVTSGIHTDSEFQYIYLRSSTPFFLKMCFIFPSQEFECFLSVDSILTFCLLREDAWTSIYLLIAIWMS